MKQYHAATMVVMVESGEVLALPGPIDEEQACRITDYLGWCDEDTFYDYQDAVVYEGQYSDWPQKTYALAA